jgi:hypothetical protein
MEKKIKDKEMIYDDYVKTKLNYENLIKKEKFNLN